jgi:glycoside/pentoside/hexuronide:cation symporter, GPH family
MKETTFDESLNQDATPIKTGAVVPFGQKLAFGFGMLANQMFPAALGIFMVVLVQDLGFPPLYWSMLFFAPRVFDAITDPIMGFISDNTKSRWGRRRQYVFIGGLLTGISYIFMWQLYPENGVFFNFLYFMFWSFVFYLGITIFGVPYVAMGYEMSPDFHERTQIMAISQFIGQWAWVIAPWFWVIFYDPAWFASPDVAVRETSIWVAIVCTILALIPAIFIKGKSTLNEEGLIPLNASNIANSFKEILRSFKEAFAIKQFGKLCIATFLIFNSFQTIAAFSFFIIVYHMFGGDAGAAGLWPTLHGCVGALVTTFVVIPVVAQISKKFGKKKTFILSQSISVIGYILFWFLFVPGKPYLFFIALPFFSFGIGGLFTLMMSMTADVCDLDELNTGKRREAMFGAIYWWMVKFGTAIAGLLTGLIMSWIHFTPGAESQPEGAVTGLRLFYTFFPIAGTLLAIYVMKDYDVTEERANEVRVKLAARRGE